MNLLMLLALATTPPQAPDARAKSLAEALLTRGAELFDAQQAADLAATYADGARLFLVEKDKDSGRIQVREKEGRGEIEAFYREMFKDRPPTKSRNAVEYARFVAPDVLVIEGEFQPDLDQAARYPFVQERVKQGDRWQILSLRLYILPGE